MILILLHYLRDSWGLNVPSVFEYHSTRMLLAAVTGLGLSIFLGPPFIRRLYELKIGQSIRKDECPLLGELHEKKQDTPTMGGLLIAFSMLIALLLWMDLHHRSNHQRVLYTYQKDLFRKASLESLDDLRNQDFAVQHLPRLQDHCDLLQYAPTVHLQRSEFAQGLTSLGEQDIRSL